MAYQYTDYSGYGNETDEETRRRRAMMMAGLGGDSSIGDIAGNMLTNRLDQAQQNISNAGQILTNPEEELKKRMGVQPVAPTVPTEQMVAQQAQPFEQQLQQYKPVAPTAINANEPMPNIGQPPTPGPATQFAGPATIGALNQPQQPNVVNPEAYTPTAERQVEPLTQDQLHHQMVIDARNEQDVNKRRENYARLIADPNVNEGTKALANRFIADDYFKQRNVDDANRKIQEATPTDLARYMKEQSKEGSYIKAILFARLGLTDLAQKEQEKIDPTITMASASDSQGNKYTVGRDKNGNITTGFDSTGKMVGQDILANLSAAAMPTKAHLMPSVHGGPVQRTNEKGEVEGGLRMYDPQTGQSYVLIGNKRVADIGFTTPTQTVQNVYGAAQAQEAGKAAGQGFTPNPLQAFPGQAGNAPVQVAGVAGAPAQGAVDVDAVRRAQGDIQSVQRELALSQQRPFGNPQQQAQRVAILNDELTKAQARLQQAQQTPVVTAPIVTAPVSNAPAVTANMPVWQQRQNAALGEAAGKENIQVAGKRSESFNKILDEEVRPQAQAGDTVSSVRKQQFAIFDRPGIDSNKLFGLYNAAQENPNDQKLSIVRDIFGGVFKPEAEVSQRLALLNLSPQERSALSDYNIANQKINAATLKQTAGPGSVSDAEQRANRESNVDPTKIPALGAYNAMARSQFDGDLARYKADWAENHPATNALQLDKAWRKESQSLSQVYGDIAKQRAQYIAGNGATTAAVRDGYKKFPIPEYNPNTGRWDKTKPLAEILGR